MFGVPERAELRVRVPQNPNNIIVAPRRRNESIRVSTKNHRCQFLIDARAAEMLPDGFDVLRRGEQTPLERERRHERHIARLRGHAVVGVRERSSMNEAPGLERRLRCGVGAIARVDLRAGVQKLLECFPYRHFGVARDESIDEFVQGCAFSRARVIRRGRGREIAPVVVAVSVRHCVDRVG